MMDLDTVSNCSSLSLRSEETKSTESTLSGLSIYQDEFTELRHLVNPTKYPNYVFNSCSSKQGSRVQYKNNCISTLSRHLEDSQQHEEKYKSDLYNLEKSLELKYYDKIEKLLKINHKLHSELDNANEQIGRLLKNYSKQSSFSSSDNYFPHLEQKYHDLTSRYSELQSEYFQIKNLYEQCETENKQLKIELSELKIDIETKNECVKELKDKISHQYVENETLLKTSFKYSQSINEAALELAHVKKTQNWYKERLHLCQDEKQVLSDEILKCKIDLSAQHERIENLNVELSKWKTKCEVIELKALQDKEKLYKQLDSVHSTNGANTDKVELNYIAAEESGASVINYYESNIQDLTHEIMKIKEYVQEQDGMIQNITKENSELIARCIILQKNVQHNQNTIEELENIKKSLCAELDETTNKVKQKSDEIITRENQILALHAELRAQKDEQDLVEQNVKTVRDQFTVFKFKYRELRDELSNKNKQILQLENEKQKLFMDNNWNICELEKLKEKDVTINQLKNELTKNNESLKEYSKTIDTLKHEINKNQEKTLSLLNVKQTIIDKDHLEINKYENVLTQYKIMITNYENQITDVTKLLNESNIKIVDLKNNIKILKQEVSQKDINLNKLNNKCITLESELEHVNENVKFSEEFHSKNDQKQLESGNNSMFNLQNFERHRDIGYKTIFSEDSLRTSDKKLVTLQDNCKILSNSQTKKILTPNNVNSKKKLMLKIAELEDRIKKLNETCSECYTTLNTIFNTIKGSNEKEQVQKLNVLLQVKELELKEKQKKYEANNRTLLRKVKEHMKGRNAAEKNNKYLQEMYNSLSDENNSLKLEIKSKECDVENMKNMLDKFTNINGKLKSSVLKLEQQVVESRTCNRCVSFDEKLESLEKCIRELENEKLTCHNILMEKEDMISDLQKEIQHLLQSNVSLNKCNKKLTDEIKTFLQDKDGLCGTIKTLENEIKQRESREDELNAVMKGNSEQFSVIVLDNNRLKNCIDELNTQVEYLTNEVKILNSRLEIKSEELNQLKDNKSKMENNWQEKEKDFQTVTNTLKRYVYDMQLEITTVNNEKNFLQRLCNDLKLALKSHASHNKVLQQQLTSVSKEKDFNSLPNVLPNISCDIKYDDDYVNQLLQQNRVPLQGKPITEMKSCLDTLKREISTLQEQITRKNIHY